MRTSEWSAKNTVPAHELGRCVNFDEVVRRHGIDAVQPVVDGYLTADDVALEVVNDFASLPPGAGRAMYKRALDEGIDAVDSPPESMRRLFDRFDNPPPWVDEEQLRRGAVAYFRAGPLVSFALTCSIIGGSERAYGITRSIVATGRLRVKAYVRAKETTRWLIAAVRPGGMSRFAEGFKLTALVRLLHASTRRILSRREDWDWNGWGMPISDADGLYAISYDFTQALVDPLRKVGVRLTDREVADIYALWRYIGWVMGVPDHLLHRDERHARQLADIYLSLDPGADDECRELLRSLIELATQEGDKSLDVFPKIVTTLFPPLRLRKLLYGFTRYWSGEEVADQLGVPNTVYKYAPHLAKPIMAMVEVGRRLRLIDDQRTCESTLELLRKAAPQARGEPLIATPADVAAGVRERAARARG